METVDARTYIGQWLQVIVDRPLGSTHPLGEVIYPVNYGYIPNTRAGDGLEQDAYILGVSEACSEYFGLCIAVIKRHDDVEDKLIIVPNEAVAANFTDQMILEATAFIEQYFDVSLIRS